MEKKSKPIQKTALAALMYIQLDDSGKPLYLQLMQHIVALIDQGRLLPEQRMLGSRTLAAHLGISRSTVIQAYDCLIAEDILYSRQKSGIFITPQAVLKNVLKSQKISGNDNISDIPPSHKKEHQQRQRIRFDSGADAKVFPTRAWLKSMKSGWMTPDPLILQDDYRTGFPRLKAALAEYLFQLRGLVCDPNQIVITAGSLDGLTLLNHVLSVISPQSPWMLENPCYSPVRTFVENRKGDCHYLTVDEEGCCLPSEQWLSVIAPPVVLMTPNRQYPLGISLSSERRRQWLNVLSQQQCWVIEDDYDNEFNYQRRDGLPLIQSDHAERTFFMGSLSKVLFRGLRLGFIVVPKSLLEQCEQSRQAIGNSSALPMQPVVAEMILNGELNRHINRMRRHYRNKRDIFIQMLEKHLSDWFVWQKPKGGMHLLLRFTSNTPFSYADDHTKKMDNQLLYDQRIAQSLSVHGMTLEPLSSFFASHTPIHLIQQGFVCGFTNIAIVDMEHIVVTIKKTMMTLHPK